MSGNGQLAGHTLDRCRICDNPDGNRVHRVLEQAMGTHDEFDSISNWHKARRKF